MAAQQSPVAAPTTVGKALAEVPIGDMIKSLGLSIATAQYELDLTSLRIAQMMTGHYEDPQEKDESKRKKTALIDFDGEKLSLLELGFTPTFYQFTETTIEIKMTISMTMSAEQAEANRSMSMDASAEAGFSGMKAKSGMQMNISTMSANFSSKYSISAEGTSMVRTKLMPVPPPALLEERIRRSLDKRKGAEQKAS